MEYKDLTHDIIEQGMYDIFYGKTEDYIKTNGFRERVFPNRTILYYKYDFNIKAWDIRDRIDGNGIRVVTKANKKEEAINYYLREERDYLESEYANLILKQNDKAKEG